MIIIKMRREAAYQCGLSHRHHQEGDADCSDDNEEYDSSQYNSIDTEQEQFFNPSEGLYSITPPNSRRMKREKSKQHTRVQRTSSYREYLDTKRKNKPLDGKMNIIKERYMDDPMFCKLSGVDSDDNLERDFLQDGKDKTRRNSRESKKKTMTTSRAHERLTKRQSGDLTILDTNTADVPMPITPVKVDTSGRFSTFNFKPSPLTASMNSAGLNASWSGRFDARRASVLAVECPKDRIEFYRIFSALIIMGSQKKDKEIKGKEKFMNSYRRQLSSEQEIWKEKYHEFLWFELQMHRNGKMTAQEQDLMFQNERQKIPQVLEEIMSFNFIGLDRLESNDSHISCSSPEDGPLNLRLTSESDSILSHDVTASFYATTLTQETLDHQGQALLRVQELLVKLDECEELFPHSKAFGKEYAQYSSHEFVQRVKSLYLWQNITRDLCHKVKLLGKVLGVQYNPNVDWPVIDIETPRNTEPRSNYALHRASIPEIQEPDRDSSEFEEDEEEEDDVGKDAEDNVKGNNPDISNGQLTPELHQKRVKFSVDSPSERSSRDTSPETIADPVKTSTPNKLHYVSSSATTLSRASSEASLDGMSKTSMYRKYVDKTLKRMGMNKMLVRFREILDRTLQRAREALERPKNLSCADLHNKSPTEDKAQLASSPGLDLLPPELAHASSFHRSTSLTDHGAWSNQFIEMGLPSFRPSYLFLLRVFLDVIHEALRLRLEQRPIGDPSFLSIRPLLRECKDVLRGSVIVKQYYQHMVAAVVADDEMDQYDEKFANVLEQFDNDMREMLEIYFTYLQNWLLMLQNLPEASRSLKNVLEMEWDFTKQICPHVTGGEAEAGKRFSTLGKQSVKFYS
ncbi:hypothetical protein KUTeg_007893 [Tegillarca granosa]|uniref:Mitogen-activated protein kinase kinase kinase N-terminal domain-containing protein n=1 Tax=Tegillarca granosa TaxID=220873 RepID=A0ABQ9FEI5_TEGGR|nr:hypothetical protein KUTeg_007893 [Tegillarca granosa]